MVRFSFAATDATSAICAAPRHGLDTQSALGFTLTQEVGCRTQAPDLLAMQVWSRTTKRVRARLGLLRESPRLSGVSTGYFHKPGALGRFRRPRHLHQYGSCSLSADSTLIIPSGLRSNIRLDSGRGGPGWSEDLKARPN
jgi:hypothetical protein